MSASRSCASDRERANLSRLGVVNGAYGPMTPRQCFEDLAYTDHFHYDIERESRRAALPPFLWEMVQFIGWDYASELAEIATLGSGGGPRRHGNSSILRGAARRGC